MKKYNLFKVLAITVCVAWLLTLFIPSSYADYSGNISKGAVAGVGVWSLLSNLSVSISYFNGIAVFIVAIACFYAVLNKLDVYKKFVDRTASIFEGKERLLVIITIIVFGILACVVSDWMILLVFVPYIYQVMNKLNIDKKVILASTIVASLIGSMCGIYNSTLFSTLSLKVNTLLLVKVIVLVLSLAVLIFFTKAPKKAKKIEKKETKKEEKKETKVKASTKTTATKKVVSKSAPKKVASKTTKKSATRKKVAK